MRARAPLLVLFALLALGACSQYPARVVFRAPPSDAARPPAAGETNTGRAPEVISRSPAAAAQAARGDKTTRIAGIPAAPPPAIDAAKLPGATRPRTPPPASIVVGKGDTVYGIARRYDIAVQALIARNGLKPPYALRVGQRLAIPRERIHVVERGETLYAIARAYRVDLAALARANRLTAPYGLRVGQRLRVPATASGEARVAKVALGSASTAPVPPPAAGPLPDPPPRSRKTFLWPVTGKLVSRFGPKDGGRRNDGINILAPRGAAVRAAEDGIVVYAGNELAGYGNLLLIRHAGGWTTAYAHNDALLVRRGDLVRRGQVIARVGSTGGVSRPQAHFEIRRSGNAIDPIKLLARN